MAYRLWVLTQNPARNYLRGILDDYNILKCRFKEVQSNQCMQFPSFILVNKEKGFKMDTSITLSSMMM